MRAVFHDDCVKNCTEVMEVKKLQLYFYPKWSETMFLIKMLHTIKIALSRLIKKADIPTGIMPAVHIFIPLSDCGYKFIKLSRLSACKRSGKTGGNYHF